jgi:hypothetical protein
MTEITTDLDTMLDSYIECALWSTTDESREDGGDPLDDNYGPEDLTPACLAVMRADCAGFLAYCAEIGLDVAELADAQMGHDFWLTRNGHGAGFWDRGLGELGDKLSKAARIWGSVGLYVGDDGRAGCY